jgi:hypothetical protein
MESNGSSPTAPRGEPLERTPRFIYTDGQGAPADDALDGEQAAAVDVALAALDHLGDALGLGSTRMAILVLDQTPLALSRTESPYGTKVVIGRPGDLPGSLLPHLRRGTTADEGAP